MIISLTGFMGCGKSSVGKALASLLSCPFVDLDTYIERREGRKIPEIFKSDGEAGFRRIEQAALAEVTAGQETMSVLSLGGGTLTTPECAEKVKKVTLCFYLRASVGKLVHNLENDFEGRPMLGQSLHNPDKLRMRIETLMKEREGVYEDTARYVIDIDGKEFNEIASEIADVLKKEVPLRVNTETTPQKKTVLDPLRRKEVALTPEEEVRQWCIRELLHGQMKVPMHMMMSETGFRLGGKQFRADILIYDRDTEPLAVVECKRPETAIDRNVLEQAIRYNMVLSVKFIIITNGIRTYIFKKGKDGYSPLRSAPVFEEMLK